MKHLLIFLFCLVVYQSPSQCLDRPALIEFQKALSQNGPWMQKDTLRAWETTQLDCCMYYGIFCDPSGRIVSIDLDGWANNAPAGINQCSPNDPIGLSGQLPNPFILPTLQFLSLSGGKISGPLPDFSGSPQLHTLHLNCNEISGPVIPEKLPEGLENLYLERNKLTGNFPNLDLRPDVKQINLAANALSGSIPNLTQVKLRTLLLTGNNLSGVIPGFRGHPLTEIDLQYNRFTFQDMLPNYVDLRKHQPKLGNQQPVSDPASITLPIGGDWVWNLDVDDTVTTSTYYWIHGRDTFLSKNNSLKREVEPSDEGVWICKIKNAIVKGVTLESGPMTVSLCQPGRLDIDIALCPGESLRVRGQIFDRAKPKGKIQIPGAAANGCDSLYIVNIRYPEALSIGPDTLVCRSEVPLRANLPIGYQGQWAALEGGLLEQSTLPVTQARNLVEGENHFVWRTVSTDCPDGDTDTILVVFDQPPVANDDPYQIFIDNDLSDNFLANDLFDPTNDRLEMSPLPMMGGDFDFKLDGNFNFDPNRLFYGTYWATYNLYSKNCPLSPSDGAMISIQVVPEQQPSFVSPNDDGENDVFVIESLAADPSEFPDNRLLIWTARGEVVLNEVGYKNTWPPQHTFLPEVYYYLFFGTPDDKEGRSGTVLIRY